MTAYELGCLLAQKQASEQYVPNKKENDEDQPLTLGPIQQAHVSDLVGASSLANAFAKIKKMPIKRDTGFFDKKLISKSPMSLYVLNKIQAAHARLAESRILRTANQLDPLKYLDGAADLIPEGTVAFLAGIVPGDTEKLKETAKKRYIQRIQKYQDPILNPAGAVTKRQNPWHVLQQGRFADLDSDVAGNRFTRKEHPFNYYLNPYSKSGPLVELRDRIARRHTAGIADPESANTRLLRLLLPPLAVYYGGEEAQQKLRRAAFANKIYAEEATPAIVKK